MPTPPIPQPLRAAAGLAAVAIDSARKLPEQLVGFPVLAVSAALQASLKAQQRYAELVVRGDQLLGQLRGQGEATPAWARFDDDLPAGAPGAGRPRSAFDLADELAADVAADDPTADGLAADDLGVDDFGVLDLGVLDLEVTDLEVTDLEVDDLEVDDLEVDDLEVDDLEVDDPEVADLLGGGEDEAAALADAAELADAAYPGGTAELGAADLGAAVDLAELAGDADLLAAAEELVEVDPPAVDDGADALAVADALAADGYLASEPPIPGYDGMSLPQLRGRLRSLSAGRVEALIAYERQVQARAPFLTMLENRLATLRSR